MSRPFGATYRLQLGPTTTFDDAAGLVEYLATLGVECLYCSPIAEAVPGSEHGYDGTDPTAVRAELGGEEGFRRLAAALEAAGLGCVVDLVPNHLATDVNGPWWRELLRHGEDSEFAEVFDVDWARGNGKVLLPLLDRPVDQALSSGGVQLVERDGEVVLDVGGLALPLDGAPSVGDDPGDVLETQHYRLVDWHDQASRNYRRFFDIDGLVGVRVERPEVFARTHELIARLARDGLLSGVRVDHVDGLRDPEQYLGRLARAVEGLPVVVEKILTGDERMRSSWAVFGTTGYEVLDDIGGALVDPIGLERLARAAEAEGEATVESCTLETRRLVATGAFGGDLAHLASRVGVAADALTEATIRLPLYRTYLDGGEINPTDAAALAQACADPAASGVREALEDPDNLEAVLSWQQLTGAVMAKGVEDTAWYRLTGKLAFCEVGADPSRSREDGIERLHARAVMRAAGPHSGLIPSTTHDTKRSGDVRARLYALSACSDRFEERLERFRTALAAAAGIDDGGVAATVLAEQSRLIAKTALAILPAVRDEARERELPGRVRDALVKGVREGKLHSSWNDPNEEYEEALGRLVDVALGDAAMIVRGAFGPLVEELARYGATTSLSMVVLRSALPGVPDCYQGDEDWNLSLVDPDNRRPVDYARLLERLEGVGARAGEWMPKPGNGAPLRRTWREGDVKLAMTAACLHARRLAPRAFSASAPYVALPIEGDLANAVLAFGRLADPRIDEDDTAPSVIAIVTRTPWELDAEDDDLPAGERSYKATELIVPDALHGRYVDALTGREVEVIGRTPVAHLLDELPAALLVAH